MEQTTNHLLEEPLNAEAIRRGLVYPPPPSFYQKKSLLPPIQPPETGNYARASTPQMPPFAPAPSAPKTSRRWIWIVIVTMSLGLILSGSLCAWAFSILLSPGIQQAAGAVSISNNYYSSIQARNYIDAYSYLATQDGHPTQQQFIDQAQSRDAQYGSVQSYTQDGTIITSNTSDFDHTTMKMAVSRVRAHYVATLTIQRIGNTWKITSFNTI